MLHCHESQMYEWLPYNAGTLAQVPTGSDARRQWLATRLPARFKTIADKYRDLLTALYGREQGSQIQYAEAFEGCEYGAALTEENKRQLFPFFPDSQ